MHKISTMPIIAEWIYKDGTQENPGDGKLVEIIAYAVGDCLCKAILEGVSLQKGGLASMSETTRKSGLFGALI